MLSVVDNFKETLNGGNPDRLVNEWEPFELVPDPLMALTLVAQPGKEVIDPWGTTIFMGENEPGAMPIVNDQNKVCPDITEWKKYVKAPDIITPEKDWTQAQAAADAVHAKGKLVMSLMPTGLFEQSHYLMGFEDTLINLLTEPESMAELLDYITQYKLEYIKLLGENLHPDAILFHDDWGSKQNMFMSTDVWRELFKENYRKIYESIHSYGAIVLHHADSYCQQIVGDMVEIGMDIWQGVLPENDIPKIQEETKGKLILMGGIDASVVDLKDYQEDVIRAEVRRACAAYAPGGSFIPCLTYGGEGSIYPEVNGIIMDEVAKQCPLYFD